MKVLVAYMSQTGNTKKVAEAIYEAIPAQKEIKRVEEVKSLEGYDLSFLGFPMHALGPAEPVINFLKSHVKDRPIALFITHASPEDAPPLQGWLQKFKDAAVEANIVGMFNCQGEMSEELANYLLKHPDPQRQEWGKTRHTTLGQPDATRIEKARIFAREIMKRFE